MPRLTPFKRRVLEAIQRNRELTLLQLQEAVYPGRDFQYAHHGGPSGGVFFLSSYLTRHCAGLVYTRFPHERGPYVVGLTVGGANALTEAG